MALSDHVIALVEELDRVHPEGIADWQVRPGEFPNFVTAENGQVRRFTPIALKEIGAIANLLYESDAEWKAAAAERQVFYDQVRRCVGNLHSLGHLAEPKADDAREARNRLRQRLKQELERVAATVVHHIPCWTTAVSLGNEFVMGPVTLRTVPDWIDWIDFQPRAYSMGTAEAQEANKEWRDLLKASLATKQYESNSRPLGFAGGLDKALSKCPAVATVTVTGYELALSKKVAHAVSQAALDCIGLALGLPDIFVFQILGSGRAEPFHWTSIVGTPEGLGFPGYSRTRHAPGLDPTRTRERLAQVTPLLTQESAMLTSLLQPTSYSQPELASRWLTAHGALQLGVAKKQLHRTQVFRSPVDQGCLGSPHRMCCVFRGI